MLFIILDIPRARLLLINMASASSAAVAAAHVLFRDKYDVFLSFRCPDTRHKFAEDLYQGLTWKTIKTFIYDKLEVGAEIEYALEVAIEQSKISIVVFSQGYASSRWCLDELVHIMKCKKRHGHIVVPVFYEIDPTVVRKQKQSYADAFAKHEQSFRYNMDKVLSYRKALSAAAALSGYHIQKYSPESAIVYTIVKEVWEKLNRISSTKSTESLLVQQIESLLSTQTQCVSIHNEVMKSPFVAAHVLPRDQYDVFLSFRGSDTRHTFTGDLYEGLTWKNINTYIDNRLERGDEIEYSLEEAIEQSKISIIVFSQDYASSRWCLDELVHILKCRERYGRIVIPVFYEIDPSVVRHQETSYADAFAAHDQRFKNNMDKVLNWREALSAAASLYGYHIQKYSPQSVYVYTIVEEVWGKLNRISSATSGDLSGNASRVQQVEAQDDLTMAMIQVATEHVTPTVNSGNSTSTGSSVAAVRSTLRNITQSQLSDGEVLNNIREACIILSGIATVEEKEIIKTLEELLASLPEALNQLKEKEENYLQTTHARNDLADQLSAKNHEIEKQNLVLHQCDADIQSLEVKISGLQAQLATKKIEKANMMQVWETDQGASRELSDFLDQAKLIAKQAENKAKEHKDAFEVLCRKICLLGNKI